MWGSGLVIVITCCRAPSCTWGLTGASPQVSCRPSRCTWQDTRKETSRGAPHGGLIKLDKRRRIVNHTGMPRGTLQGNVKANELRASKAQSARQKRVPSLEACCGIDVEDARLSVCGECKIVCMCVCARSSLGPFLRLYPFLCVCASVSVSVSAFLCLSLPHRPTTAPGAEKSAPRYALVRFWRSGPRRSASSSAFE